MNKEHGGGKKGKKQKNKNEKMIKSYNQELMAGKILSHGEMIDYSTWGEKMVKKAEQQIENNNRAMQIHKESLLTR